MTTIEEQIWDYIDNNCSPEEKSAIASKIASDAAYQQVYQELSIVNQHLAAIENEEPSMAFNRKVMEALQHEIAPVSLKTKVDRRIILGIGSFFILLMLAILIAAVAQTKFSFSEMKMGVSSISFDISPSLSSTFIRVFLFTDLVLAFLYFDYFLRRKKAIK